MIRHLDVLRKICLGGAPTLRTRSGIEIETADEHGPRPVGRRAFAAGLAAAASAAILGGRTARAEEESEASFANLDDPDAVKRYLEDIKDLVCGVSYYVMGDPGPLHRDVDRSFVRAQITTAAMIGQALLSRQESLLHASPEDWLYWTPANVTSLNLTGTADAACDLACLVLEEYCEGLNEDASRGLWQLEQVYCHLFVAAGIH